MDIYLPRIVMADNPINHLRYRNVLGFGFDAGDERPFDVEGPALGRSGGVTIQDANSSVRFELASSHQPES